MMEVQAQHYFEQTITTSTYTELRLGSSRVALCVRYLSARPATILTITTIGSVSTTNIIPLMLVKQLKLLKKTKKRELVQTKQN